MIQQYHISDLIELTGEFPHLLELVNSPPISTEDEIFLLLDDLTERLKQKTGKKSSLSQIKTHISEWIDEKIKEKQDSQNSGQKQEGEHG